MATVGIVGMDSKVPVERGGLVSCSEMAVRRDLPRDVMTGYCEGGLMRLELLGSYMSSGYWVVEGQRWRRWTSAAG